MPPIEAAAERYPHDFQCVVLKDGSYSTWRVGRVSEVDGMVNVSDDDVSANYPRTVVSELWPIGGQRIDRSRRPARRMGELRKAS